MIVPAVAGGEPEAIAQPDRLGVLERQSGVVRFAIRIRRAALRRRCGRAALLPSGKLTFQLVDAIEQHQDRAAAGAPLAVAAGDQRRAPLTQLTPLRSVHRRIIARI
jgi:hypothetical protein